MSDSPTAIAIAVVQQGDGFLIGQRPDGVALAGYWEFPGGKVEAGERAEDAAVRECLEEAGLVVQVVDEYPAHVQQYDHDKVSLRFFRCLVSEERSVPNEPFRWVPRSDLAKYEFPKGNRGLLALLLADAS